MLASVILLASPALVRPAAADTAWLGVYSQQITPELREGLDYDGGGAVVTRVLRGSPAERAGIERGDVIVRVGAAAVDSPDALADAVHSTAAGKTVDVVVVREGQRRTLRVTFTSRGESSRSGDFDTPAPPAPPQVEQREPDEPSAPEAPETPAPPRPRSDRLGGRDFVMRLPDGTGLGMMGRGRLGVRIESLNPDLASYFGSRDARGALVLDVTDGSAADKAGIRAGDVITRVGPKSIGGADDLMEAVRSSEGAVAVTLLRHGAKQTMEANLGPMPKVMRYKNDSDGFRWKSQDGKTWMDQSPDGSGRPKRIVIDGDEDNAPDSDHPAPGAPQMEKHVDPNADGSMMRRRTRADRETMDELRDEIQQLREQLDQLRKEMKSNSNR